MRLSYFVILSAANFVIIPFAVYTLLVGVVNLYFTIKCRRHDIMSLIAYSIMVLVVLYGCIGCFMSGGWGISLNMPAYMADKEEKYSGILTSVVEATEKDTYVRDTHKYYIENDGNTSEFFANSQYIYMVRRGDNIVAYKFPFTGMCHLFKVNDRVYAERYRGAVYVGVYLFLAGFFLTQRKKVKHFGELSEVIKKLYLFYVFGIGISLLLLTGKCYLLLYILWLLWYVDIYALAGLYTLTDIYIYISQGILGVYPENEIECGMHILTKKEVIQFYLGAFLS